MWVTLVGAMLLRMARTSQFQALPRPEKDICRLVLSKPYLSWGKLDKSLTFRHQITQKTSSRVTLLRRLVDSGWGAGAKTLLIATLSLVYLTAEYCAPVWCCSSHSPHRQCLERRLAHSHWMPASHFNRPSTHTFRHSAN